MAAAMARLAALAAGFGSALRVIGEITRAVLTADVTGARRPHPIFREVARISGMWVLGH